ncbi:PorP/SprF family type IX secretion system membrane protein [Aquimarina spongiae]|uniref:Type IX secretion system membrane protein, PorP/SprF family n=1 Tax=Aquimarina spongiae TaxID=570521 RepID=A0A1M6AQL5_9FLAO|nr:type IX secretion system membrane protein PorP/SprF [Aquimarina spongiae]SHI38766.1 type IX secretion system membrane protein, PorP/SprF family [Aquimarina spongiae]
MKKIIFSLALVLCSVAYAQQEPQYSQYMYNMSTVNPGYVTNQSGLISTGLLYRRQWTGIEGSPETTNVFGNIPLSEKIELSVNYVNDKIGDAIPVVNDYINLDFAYITRISDQAKLSYGLKAGINNFRIDPSGSDVADDPAFRDNTSTTQLNIGAGVYLFTSNFYAGLSSPNLLPSDIDIDGIGVSQTKTHIYGIAGYVFDFVDEVKLKPSFVVKQVIDSPLTFDISLNSLIYDKFELGVSYRYTDSFIALAGFNITQNLKVGYSYDFSVSELSGFNNGSHEIVLLYNFDLLRFGNQHTSPRFF